VVIPEFAPLFVGEETRLPAVTRLVLLLSDAATNRLSAIVLAFLLIGLSVYLGLTKVAPLRAMVQKILLRLPPVQYALRLQLARTIQVFGALLSSGVEASEAMELASAVASNASMREEFRQGARFLREGGSVVDAVSGMACLPPGVVTLIAVGERSGELGRVTMRSAQVLESDTNRRIDRFLATLNPVAIVTLGGIVAVLIASVMLGILSINQLALR
jgi:general secretion pathway protein F